ncbi:MAG: response regulator [Turicibacter sp.]|nr:response regulator [Turicibacter sp.]
MEGLFKVLLVDDEPLMREGIKSLVDWEGKGFFIIGEASNGHEALEKIEVLSPHLVFTDIVMPQMGGEELTSAIKEKYPEMEVVILSSYADYDYVRKTFQHGVLDYMLKPKMGGEELSAILEKSLSILKAKQLQKSMDEATVKQVLLEKLLQENPSALEGNGFSQLFGSSEVYLMGLPKTENPEKIASFIKGFSDGRIYTYEGHPKLNLWLGSGTTSLTFKKWQELADSLAIKIYWVEGLKNAEAVFAAYHEILPKLLDAGFYSVENTCYTSSSHLKEDLENADFEMEGFIELIQKGQYTKGKVHALESLKAISREGAIKPEEFRRLLSSIIFSASLALRNQASAAYNVNREKLKFIKQVNQIESALEGCAIIKEFLGDVERHFGTCQEEKEVENIHLIVDYIKKNYEKPVSLKNVADYFHFNPSYLSSYFSSHYPEGFIDYVNKIRVKEATYLLMGTKKTIAEIGNEVGFSEHSYFCKVFKKTTGFSPSAYRKNN